MLYLGHPYFNHNLFEIFLKQILGGEDFVREKSIKFLTIRVRSLGKEVLSREAEDYMIVEVKKVLQVQ